MRPLNTLLVVVLLLAVADCRIRRMRRSFGGANLYAHQNPDLTQEERTALIENNRYGKGVIGFVAFSAVFLASIALLFVRRKASVEVPTLSAFDTKQAQQDLEFMLKHGKHPSRTGAKGKEYYKKYR